MKTNYILVTGASSGIGRQIVEDLSIHGYQCILIGRNKNNLKTIVDEIHYKYGVDHLYYTFDLINTECINEIIAYLKAQNLSLCGLVYSAGISPLCRIDEIESNSLLATFQINVLSFMQLCSELVCHNLIIEGGSIIAISSVVSLTTSNRQSIYISSKAALNAAVKCYAKELIKKNIRVNAILPGNVDTAMLNELKKKSPNLENNLKNIVPLGLITTEAISYWTLHFLSEETRYITGTLMVIDSGYLLNK